MNNKLNLIRAMAILMVMFGHSIIIYDSSWSLFSSAQDADYFVQIKTLINLVQMPLFFALSGYLFVYSLHKQPALFKFVKSKVRRLLIPYVLLGCLIMLPIKMMLSVPGHEVGNAMEVVRLYIGFLTTKGFQGHLWFLSTLFLLMLLAYLLVREKKVLWWDALLVFLSIGATLLPLYLDVSLPCLTFTCRFALYFFFGITMAKYRLDTGPIQKCPLIFCMLLGLCVIFVEVRELKPLLSLSLVFFVFRFFPDFKNQIVEKISANSFGLYLFHSPLIYFTFTFWPDVHPLVMLMINFIVFGGIAFFITEWIRRFSVAKLVIGE